MKQWNSLVLGGIIGLQIFWMTRNLLETKDGQVNSTAVLIQDIVVLVGLLLLLVLRIREKQ
jgi:hypothetical protein